MPGSGGERMRLAAREASVARDARGTARTAIEAAARGRQHDGTEATLAATSRLQGRARALLHAEADVAARGVGRGRSAAPQAGPWPMAPPEGPPSAPPPRTGPASGSDVGPLAALADAGARAERALLLVEKVELLLRSGRPALSVSLRTREPARVELQRVGRAAVSLRLAAARPLPPEEVDLLRTALATRGLTLRALEWVPLQQGRPGPRSSGPSSRIPPDPGGR